MVGTSEDLMDDNPVLSGKSCLSLRRQSYFPSPRQTTATVPFLRPKKKKKNQNSLLPKELNTISEPNRNTPGMLSQGRSQGQGEEVISAPHARLGLAGSSRPRSNRRSVLQDTPDKAPQTTPTTDACFVAKPHSSPQTRAALLLGYIFMLKG